jgi:putative CocE/NonD family hydrolase
MDMTDLVLWLANQPWSNGKVAMMGGSYLGMTQWWAAREAPPPLTTIVPIAAVCMGVDFPMSNGIPGTDDLAWLAYVAGRPAHPKLGDDDDFWRRAVAAFVEARQPFRSLDSFLGTPSRAFQEELEHPTYDAFWKSSRPTPAQYEAMKQSVLTITGDYDDDQLGALTYYRDHMQYGAPEVTAEHYLVIGPWDHAGTREPKQTLGGLRLGEASLVDVKKLGKDWYDWRVKGRARPALLADRVAYYVAGPHAEKWKYAHTLEAVTKARARFFLGSVAGAATDLFHSGSLEASPADRSRASGFDGYVYDPRDISYADRIRRAHHDDDWATTEDGLADLHGQALVYHSDPLPEEMELAGTMRLSVWLAMDVPDTDVYASVYEITPEGKSILLGLDGIRARYRNSFERETPVPPGVTLRYDFDHFRFLGRRLGKGSRLRLVVGAPNSSGIVWLTCGGTPCTPEKNYNSGGVVADESVNAARVAHVTLLHDESHPSMLDMPVGR